MTKTLLSMPTKTISRLKSLAHSRKTSVSHLLREAVQKTYGIDAGLKQEIDWKNDPLVKLFGTLREPKDGPDDLAENHDFYLYGWDKKRKRRK